MKSYPDLSVEQQTKPEPYDLYGIKPRANRASFRECLTSYLVRLSKKHHAVPKIMVQKVIRDRFDTSESLGSVYGKAYLANGFGELAHHWSELFNQKTGRSDLGQLTLLSLKGVISNRHLLREEKAWCSRCLEEWLSEGLELYNPLLWQLEPVQVCPNHRIKLTNQCPNCSNTVPILTGRSRIGLCPNCDAWLGEKGASSKHSISVSEWDLWIANQSVKLLEVLQSCSKLPEELVARRLHSVVDRTEELTGAEIARKAKVKKSTVWSWLNGKSKPTLKNLLKLCFVLNGSIAEFCSGEIVSKPRELRVWEQKQAIDREPAEPVNEQELESVLREALNRSGDSPSLRQVAKKTPHQQRILRKYFPKLSRTVSKKYRSCREEQFQKMKTKITKEVCEAIDNLHERGIYPSKPQIEESLSRPGYLKLPGIREIWREEIKKKGYK